MPPCARSLAWLALLAANGCSYHSFSPPARSVRLESPQALPVGRQQLSVSGLLGSAPFGPEIAGGALRYRRGMVEQLEGSAEVSLLHLLSEDETVHTWPQIYSARAGVKYQPVMPLALGFGLGGGGSAAGGFIAPDLGIVLGYENPYVVPFLSAHGFISQPLAARSVYLGFDEGEPHFSRPQTTIGAGAELGVRVPLQRDTPVPHALVLGFGLTELWDHQTRNGVLHAALGVDIAL